jgi:chorismate dehydratase
MVAIGNKTFMLAKNFKYVYDLSDEWNKFTGLPFVFACWIRRTDLPEKLLASFSDSLKWGLENMEKAIKTLFSPEEFPGIDIKEYLEKNIDFKFDEQKHKALKLYLDYLKTL